MTLIENIARELRPSCAACPVCRLYDRHDISFKKSQHAAEQDREDVRQARTRWRQEQPQLDLKKLVFIDETKTSTNMTRLRGRCPRGKRLVAKAPHGHCKMTTLVTGLRQCGMTAPFLIDAPTNGEIVISYLEQCLMTTAR